MSDTHDPIRQELRTLMAKHDWYYDRSDDGRVYAAGRENFERMMSLVKQLPDGHAFYQANQPKA